jgi:hypothetical protein
MTSKAFGLAQLGNAYADGALSNRNKIINGAMTIDQRNAGAAVSGNGDFPVDRFRVFENTSATYTAQRSATAPSNYTNSLLFTVGSAASATAAEYAGIETRIEGFNVADIGFGTAACKTVTLSFVVRSSVTGTYCVALTNSADNRVYVAEYTINSADTFEVKSVTAPAITSGTWSTDVWQTNGPYSRTTNQIDFVNNAGATFYLTGVQLEAGDTATPFEHRSYGAELALCQRYYYKNTPSSYTSFMAGFADSALTCFLRCDLPVTMRASPTFTQSGNDLYRPGGGLSIGAISNRSSVNSGSILITTSGATTGEGCRFESSTSSGTGGYVEFSAEL